jgi:hypothetical protein
VVEECLVLKDLCSGTSVPLQDRPGPTDWSVRRQHCADDDQAIERNSCAGVEEASQAAATAVSGLPCP